MRSRSKLKVLRSLRASYFFDSVWAIGRQNVEASFGRTLLRVHRRWLVNADHVRLFEHDGDEYELFVGGGLDELQGVWVPVARERSAAIRALLLAGTTGLRRP